MENVWFCWKNVLLIAKIFWSGEYFIMKCKSAFTFKHSLLQLMADWKLITGHKAAYIHHHLFVSIKSNW